MVVVEEERMEIATRRIIIIRIIVTSPKDGSDTHMCIRGTQLCSRKSIKNDSDNTKTIVEKKT